MKLLSPIFVTSIFVFFFKSTYAQIDIDAKLPSAAEELAKSFNTYLDADNKGNVRVGVLEFENNSEQRSELGMFLCNEMTTWLSLYANNKFTVIFRQDLERIIQEKEASTKYRTNKEKIEVLKRYKLTDYVLTATITQFSEQYRLNVRILSTDNENAGSVTAVKIINLNRTSDLDKMFSPKQETTKPDIKIDKPDNADAQSSTGSSQTSIFKDGEILEGTTIGKAMVKENSQHQLVYSILVNCKGRKIEVFEIPYPDGDFINLDLMMSNTIIINFKYNNGIGKYLSYVKKNN